MAVSKNSSRQKKGPWAALLGMSVVAGVLVTAAITPAVAVTGITASSGMSLLQDLPDYLDVTAIPQKSTVYAKDAAGEWVPLASFYQENREALAWDQIPQIVKDAAIAGEDPRFYNHGGVDIQGTIRGVLSTVLGQGVQGGSSITQQFVKNVLITQGMAQAKSEEERRAAFNAATEVTVERKLKEMRYALAIEKQFTKKEILLGYLNIAYFGGQVYGIQAASQYYYGKDAADLTLAEAASLLAIVNWPEKFRLDYPNSETNGEANNYANNTNRRNYILGKMLEQQMITQAEYDEAVASVTKPNITQPSTGCQTAGSAAYFCDYVGWIVKNAFDDPRTEDENEGVDLLRTGGLNIYTTLDLELQAAAAEAMYANVPTHDERMEIGSAAVSVQPGTGRVLAMAQNTLYSQDPAFMDENPGYSAVNFSTDFNYGGSRGFQPGSTYKTFTLAEWLNSGHSLNETFNGMRREFTTFTDSCAGGAFTLAEPWNPKNDSGDGANNALVATIRSVNTSFVSMASQLDLCAIKKVAEAFGVHRADGNELQMNPSDVLGTQEVAPLTMAVAFAGMANDGLTCSPVAIEKLTDSRGNEYEIPETECVQSVSKEVAHAMQYAMAQVFSGTASASRTGTDIAHIGKTGTTDRAVHTWMVGSSTTVSTAVWVGNIVGTKNIRGISFREYGGNAATARHRIWPKIMKVADEKYGGATEFVAPEERFTRMVTFTVPTVTGLTLLEAQKVLEAAGYIFEDGGQIDAAEPIGTVVATDPSGQVGRGTPVKVYTSNGSMMLMVNVVGKDSTAAETELRNAGYSVQKTTQQVTDPTQINKVLSQNVAAGTLVKYGSTIQLVVGAP